MINIETLKNNRSIIRILLAPLIRERFMAHNWYKNAYMLLDFVINPSLIFNLFFYCYDFIFLDLLFDCFYFADDNNPDCFNNILDNYHLNRNNFSRNSCTLANYNPYYSKNSLVFLKNLHIDNIKISLFCFHYF